MASNQSTYTLNLDLNVDDALKQYQSMISQMQKQGGSTSLMSGLQKELSQLQTKFSQLSAKGTAGVLDSKSIKSYEQEVTKLTTQAQTLGVKLKQVGSSGNNFPNNEVNTMTKSLEKANEKLTELSKVRLDNLTSNLQAMGFSDSEITTLQKTVKEYDDLEKAIKRAKQARKEESTAAKGNLNAVRSQVYQNFAQTSGSQVISGQTASAVQQKLMIELDLDDTLAQIAIDELNETIQTRLGKGSGLEQTQEALNATLKASLGDQEDIDEEIIEQITHAKELKTALEEAFSARSAALDATPEGQAYNQAVSNYQLVGNGARNSDLANNSLLQFQNDSQNINNQETTITNLTAQIQTLTQQFQQFLNSMQSAGDAANNTMQQGAQATQDMANKTLEAAQNADQLDKTFERMGQRINQLFGIGTVFREIRKVVQETFQDTQNLDKAFASIAMVTDYSVEDMWSSYSDYADMAAELGQSTQSVIESSALFYQQGLDTAEALSLTEDTMKLATLAGIDYSTATQEMTAA